MDKFKCIWIYFAALQGTHPWLLCTESLGKEIEDHLEAKKEEDVKEAGAENANDDEEEEKLVAEMKKELAADKVNLETAPIVEQEWK